MSYIKNYKLLRSVFNQQDAMIRVEGSPVVIHNCHFESANTDVLPGRRSYTCQKHGETFKNDSPVENQGIVHPSLSIPDCDIECNKEFTYTIFKKDAPSKAEDCILLFHGLNEKYWLKYLPWAYELCRQTGKAVILFPIAFHMNRAPQDWSRPAKMQSISKDRKKAFPALAESSFANSAISTRLQSIPQRFFWSGLQSYYDIIQLVHSIRAGDHSLIKESAGIDLFGYSIGSFLAEIILMTNTDNLFSETRLFMFCGGPTLDRMNPVSRYILDSSALVSLYSFYIHHLENEFEHNLRLRHYFKEGHSSGGFFESMLNYHSRSDQREQRFNELSDRIMALVLKNDAVIPAVEALNTLKGTYRDIPIPVMIEDFPYTYRHVNPFPINGLHPEKVEESFRKTFATASEFLSLRH